MSQQEVNAIVGLRTEVAIEVSKGGEYLGAARTWMQSNVPQGDTLTWGSSERVSIPFRSLEELAKVVATAVVLQERMNQRRKAERMLTATSTPSSRWAEAGEPDPHNDRYGVDRQRSDLCLGNLTDDELANEAYLNYDVRPTIHELIAGTRHTPLVYMTAVKERIRWLSRNLEAALKCRSS